MRGRVGSLLCRSPQIQSYYFFQFSSQACITPFLNLAFRRAGLPESQIGVISALRPWISAPSSFGWAAIADKFSVHRTMFFVAYLSSTMVRSLLVFPLPGPFWGILTCMLATEVLVSPVSVLADTAVVASLPDSKRYGRLRMWGAAGWGIMALLAGYIMSRYGIFVAWCVHWALAALTLATSATGLPFDAKKATPAEHQIDASVGREGGQDSLRSGPEKQHMVVRLVSSTSAEREPSPKLQVELTDRGDSGTVGQQTVNTVLSPATSGIPAGQLLQSGADSSEQDPTDINPMPCSPEGAEGAVESQLERQPSLVDHSSSPDEEAGLPLYEDYEDSTLRKEAGEEAGPVATDMKGLLLHPQVLLFLGLVAVMGTAVGVIDGYLFLYLDELGGSETLMGTCLTFTCIMEVPVFFFASSILTALGSDGTLHLVMAAFTLRLLAYSTLLYWPSPWMVLPVELLHGITFGCAWAAGTHKCAQLAPENLRATILGLFKSAYFGFGRGLGALVGGLVYAGSGAAVMYRVALLWTVTGWAIQILLSRFIVKRVRAVAAP